MALRGGSQDPPAALRAQPPWDVTVTYRENIDWAQGRLHLLAAEEQQEHAQTGPEEGYQEAAVIWHVHALGGF